MRRGRYETVLIQAMKSPRRARRLRFTPGNPKRISPNSSLSPHCAAPACDWIVKRTIHGPLTCERVSCRYQRHLGVRQTAAGCTRHVIRWLEAADPDSLFASVITLGEIRLGIEDLPAGKRRTESEEWLDHRLPDWF